MSFGDWFGVAIAVGMLFPLSVFIWFVVIALIVKAIRGTL